MNNTFNCPVCGGEVKEGKLACPHCGSDNETGWSEETMYDGVEFPDEAFNEFTGDYTDGTHKAERKVGNVVFIIVGIVVIVAFILATIL